MQLCSTSPGRTRHLRTSKPHDITHGLQRKEHTKKPISRVQTYYVVHVWLHEAAPPLIVHACCARCKQGSHMLTNMGADQKVCAGGPNMCW